MRLKEGCRRRCCWWLGGAVIRVGPIQPPFTIYCSAETKEPYQQQHCTKNTAMQRKFLSSSNLPTIMNDVLLIMVVDVADQTRSCIRPASHLPLPPLLPSLLQRSRLSRTETFTQPRTLLKNHASLGMPPTAPLGMRHK